MHPNKIRDFVLQLRDSGHKSQIFLTTHSPLLATFAEIEEVVLARKMSGYTKLKQVRSDVAVQQIAELTEVRRKIFEEYQKTELLFSRGIVFVEGPSDRLIFEMGAIAEGFNLSELGISIIDVGGKGSHLPYITLCAALQVPWVVLFDSDAYVDQAGTVGNVLKDLVKRTWLSQGASDLVVRDWQAPAKRRKHLKAVNETLRKHSGAICPFTFNDMQDCVRHIVKGQSADFIKAMYIQFGGHANESDAVKIAAAVDKSLGDIANMQAALEKLPKNQYGAIADAISTSVSLLHKMMPIEKAQVITIQPQPVPVVQTPVAPIPTQAVVTIVPASPTSTSPVNN
jgi:predicted ATP-dependent endonuclease of OLD family